MDLGAGSIWAVLFSAVLALVQGQTYRNVCGLQDTYKCMLDLRKAIVLPQAQLQDDQEIDAKGLKTKCTKAVQAYEKCSGTIIKLAKLGDRVRNISPCPSLVGQMYEDLSKGIRDGYKYLCKDGFQKYLNYVKCISAPNTKASVAPCNKRHWDKWQDLFMGAYSNEYSKAYIAMQTCKNVDALKSCVKAKVQEKCGVKASIHQASVLNKITRPQVADIICDPNKGTHKWATFWILLILGTAAFGAVHVVLVKMGMMAPILPIPGLT